MSSHTYKCSKCDFTKTWVGTLGGKKTIAKLHAKKCGKTRACRRSHFENFIYKFLKTLTKFGDEEKQAFWKWGATQTEEPQLARLFEEGIKETIEQDINRLMMIDLRGAVHIAKTFSFPKTSKENGLVFGNENPCMKYAGNCCSSNFLQLVLLLGKEPNAKMFYILQGENEIFHAIVVSNGNVLDVSNGKSVRGSYEEYKRQIPHKIIGECKVKRTETVLKDGKQQIQVEKLTTHEDVLEMLLRARHPTRTKSAPTRK